MARVAQGDVDAFTELYDIAAARLRDAHIVLRKSITEKLRPDSAPETPAA